MSDTQRERLATIIRAWSDGARLLAQLSRDERGDDRRLVDALLERLQEHSTMQRLAEAYLADAGNWPADLPWPGGHDLRGRQSLIVAAAYWQRHQQLLAQLAGERSLRLVASDGVPVAGRPRELGPEFGHLELVYTIKLWQRGPLRLRALPADVRPRYEAVVERVYARLAQCRSVRDLAAHYYGDGDFMLELGREELQPLGEPTSSIGWVQDAACWRRYQELLDDRAAGQRPPMAPSTFAIWLGNEMARQRVSVAELAYRLGTAEETIRSWLRAADLPGAEHGRRLAATFGLSESQLPQVRELAS